eukprot:m.76176 g.76176  ORF g.76176 m.76176 type:complete len:267 (+) comp12480_c0_seq4:162-962(+)
MVGRGGWSVLAGVLVVACVLCVRADDTRPISQLAVEDGFPEDYQGKEAYIASKSAEDVGASAPEPCCADDCDKSQGVCAEDCSKTDSNACRLLVHSSRVGSRLSDNNEGTNKGKLPLHSSKKEDKDATRSYQKPSKKTLKKKFQNSDIPQLPPGFLIVGIAITIIILNICRGRGRAQRKKELKRDRMMRRRDKLKDAVRERMNDSSERVMETQRKIDELYAQLEQTSRVLEQQQRATARAASIAKGRVTSFSASADEKTQRTQTMF